MTVGKMSVICWTVFVIMSIAFLPAIQGVYAIPGLPGPVRLAGAVFIVVVLWWGPFGYGMYLSQVGMGKNDKGLLTRGVAGTAVVLSAKATGTLINRGGFEWEGGRVYLYRLRVTVPGWDPYETSCRIVASGIRPGETVKVAVARRNPQRVTIDVADYAARTRHAHPAPHAAEHHHHVVEDRIPPHQTADGRIQHLMQLAQLHKEGALTDAEFAAEKARLLAAD